MGPLRRALCRAGRGAAWSCPADVSDPVNCPTSGCYMANDEHVAILKKGVRAWNAWRMKNPYIHVDLTGANLSQAT
jgi:hypothetical protein